MLFSVPNTANGACTATINSTIGDTICGPGSLKLQATGSTGTACSWYAAQTGGNPIGAGNTFYTPVISGTTTYYVSAAGMQSVGHTGAPGPNAGSNWGSTNLNGYQIFSVTKPLVLQSVSVYPTMASNITVALQSSAGVTLFSATFDLSGYTPYSYVPVGGGGNTTIGTSVVLPLNFSIQPGTGYKLVQTDNNSRVVRNTAGVSSSYYDIDNNGIIFTGNFLGSDPGDKNYWYNFYDFVVLTTDSSCESLRVPVVAKVSQKPPVYLGKDTTVCGTVNVELNGTTNGNNLYKWSNNASTPTTTVTTSGNYAVTVTDAATGCSASDTIAVLADVLPTVAGVSHTVSSNGRTYYFTATQAQNGSTYFWNFGDGTSSSSVNPTHTYPTDGAYTVSVCVTNKCNTECDSSIATGNTAKETINVLGVTGISDVALESDIKLYPVPAHNYLTIESQAAARILQADVYDAQGRLAGSMKYDNTAKAQLTISELAEGIYCVRLTTTSGVAVKRFEVTR